METVNTNTTKKKGHGMLWLGFGTLVLGTLTFFGIKHFKKPKDENNDTTNQTTSDMDTKKSIQNHPSHKSNSNLPPASHPVSFPMRIGSKGDQVRLLQQSLIRTYGASLLAKHGADGQFGSELDSALRSKGYGVPLQESDFFKITGAKKEQVQEVQKTPASLLAFNPAAIARGIYFSLIAKNFNSAFILLKSIKNKTNYSLVNEQFKNYKIGGVSQSLVNGLLKTFTASSQKTKIQDTLKSIGLKYDGKKWTIPNQ